MTTKYAAARDVAYQWRAEYRTTKAENKSLRRVYAHAKAMSEHIAGKPGRKTLEELQKALADSLRNARFAEGGE